MSSNIQYHTVQTDEVGLAAALRDDKKLTKTTSLFEILDNCIKAMAENTDEKIKVIDTENVFAVLDNGCGFKIKDAENIMTQFRRSDSNGESLSHYGIGLKSTLHYKLKNSNSYGFMVSSCQTRRGKDYCLFSITIGTNGCLQISNPHSPTNEWNESFIKPIIPHSGTLLFVVNDPILNDNDDNDEYDIIEKFCNSFQSWDEKNQDNISQLKKDYNYYLLQEAHGDGIDMAVQKENLMTLNELCKLWSPLIENGLNISYNGIQCIADNFIKPNDTLVFSTRLYINTDNPRHIIIAPEYELQYEENQQGTSDGKPISRDPIVEIAIFNFYIAEKANRDEKRIQYSFQGNRILQRNKFSQSRGHQNHTHLTMRAECIFTNMEYVKKELLEAKKTPDDMLSVEASTGRMKFINNSLTRMCLNNDILKNYNYYCRGLCEDGHGNVTAHTEGIPPQPDGRRREFTATQRREIQTSYNSCCGICGMFLDHNYLRIEYDHIIPFSEGGLTEVENGQPLCVNCHKRKTTCNIDSLSDEEKKEYLDYIIDKAIAAKQLLEN
jgi:hypothetical protein